MKSPEEISEHEQDAAARQAYQPPKLVNLSTECSEGKSFTGTEHSSAGRSFGPS